MMPTRFENADERLVELAYELMDAHDDTARLAGELTTDLHWAAHLDYLRDLQRVGRELLAQVTDRAPAGTLPRSRSR
jgi:hypothetical protein